MDMPFVLAILWIVLLIALWGCLCFARKLYISCHSEQGVAFVDRILRESYTYRPTGWHYRAVVRIPFQGQEIKQELSFWMRKRATVSTAEGDAVPVLVHTSKQGENRVLVKDSKTLLVFLTCACGLIALLFGLVIGLVIIYGR